MGAGSRIDAGKVHLDKLSHTHHDGLSKAVRRQINNKKISDKLVVVFSDESPIVSQENQDNNNKKTVGTISYLPTVFGCYLSQYVINQLITKQ